MSVNNIDETPFCDLLTRGTYIRVECSVEHDRVNPGVLLGSTRVGLALDVSVDGATIGRPMTKGLASTKFTHRTSRHVPSRESNGACEYVTPSVYDLLINDVNLTMFHRGYGSR